MGLNLYPVAFLDPPLLLDAAVNNIPASSSSPYQVVAKLAKTARAIKVLDGIGKYIGVYAGPPGSEILKAIIGGGASDIFPCVITEGQRVSLRNLANSVINTGTIALEFLGQS